MFWLLKPGCDVCGWVSLDDRPGMDYNAARQRRRDDPALGADECRNRFGRVNMAGVDLTKSPIVVHLREISCGKREAADGLTDGSSIDCSHIPCLALLLLWVYWFKRGGISLHFIRIPFYWYLFVEGQLIGSWFVLWHRLYLINWRGLDIRTDWNRKTRSTEMKMKYKKAYNSINEHKDSRLWTAIFLVFLPEAVKSYYNY